uniref:CSON003935 protein n=1 Tax=Culicoides sonorensis TaxID=179676 RepID=A0A336L6B5_CULSO
MFFQVQNSPNCDLSYKLPVPTISPNNYTCKSIPEYSKTFANKTTFDQHNHIACKSFVTICKDQSINDRFVMAFSLSSSGCSTSKSLGLAGLSYNSLKRPIRSTSSRFVIALFLNAPCGIKLRGKRSI